jgi:hypothetical protein
MTNQEAQQKIIANFFDKAKLYLDPEDQHKTHQELELETKAHCYILLAAALHAPLQIQSSRIGSPSGFAIAVEREKARLEDFIKGFLLAISFTKISR